MAIEIPNFFEAAGVFDGFDPPINPTNPIFSSNGVQPFNPATTSGDPVGGFTRLGFAAYVVNLVRPIDVLESVCLVTCNPLAQKPVDLCGSVAGGLDDSVDGTVLIAGNPADEEDAIFQLGVFRFRSDLIGTEPLVAP